METSTDTLTNTDTAIATSAAVKDYVDQYRGTGTISRSAELGSGSNSNYATIGSLSAGVYGLKVSYQYENNLMSGREGTFELKINNQRVSFLRSTGTGDWNVWRTAGYYGSTSAANLGVYSFPSGGSVKMIVTRDPTYGGSNAMTVRNFTMEFTRLA